MKLRIVVADDNASFLQEFISVLGEFEIVARASDGRAVLECARRCRPDIVVLDIGMPLLNGIEVTQELMRHPPSPAVVICSVETEPEIVDAAREAGALGYVFKARIAQDLVKAVKAAAEGESFVSPS